jgi:glycosyltransferase involved in cell wall biosynthesis
MKQPPSVKPPVEGDRAEVVLFANTDWYLYNFRRSLAQAIRDRGQSLLLISPPGEYGPKLREMGFRWEPLNMGRRSLRLDAELRVILDLARILRRERPKIIHSFTIKAAVYGALAARLARVTLRVNAVTGLGYVYSSKDWRARMLAPFDGPGSILIVQNPDDEQQFQKLGFDADRLRLIPGSGVDCRRFVARPPALATDRPTRVVFCGRILWDKGVAEFVEAARRMSGSPVEFIVAGAPDPGNPAAVSVTILEDWRRVGGITWLGHVDDIPGLLAQTDIFVLPSYREGLPKSLIEAAACALPLIATDAPGCREVIQHEVDGLLVPVRDAAAIVAAIRRYLENPEFAARLGAAAREKALSQFDERIIVSRTLAVYAELMAKHRRQGQLQK